MQTFLPYPDFAASARVLDNRRLGKQRVEAVQVMRTLLGVGSGGWSNHPAVKMWRGREAALWEYTRAVCDEWIARGYDNTKCEQHLADLAVTLRRDADRSYAYPDWLGDEALHESHRANLVRKLPEHYGALWPDVQPAEGYVWPN